MTIRDESGHRHRVSAAPRSKHTRVARTTPTGIVKAMADPRKRREAPGLSSATRRRQRNRLHDETEEANRMMTALTAIVIMVGVVATEIEHSYAPEVRQPVYEAPRLLWEDHRNDLEERSCFRRYYRMDVDAFNKLAELLRPLLERNERFASKSAAAGAHNSGQQPRPCPSFRVG